MEQKDIYTTKETSKYLGISTATIYRMEKQGLLSPIKTPGGQRRFSKENIEKYLEKSQNFTAPQNPSKYKRTDSMIKEPESIYSIENINPIISTSNELFSILELENIKNTIIQNDCIKTLKQIKSNSVNLVITSPPYYKQREYGGIGIGNELTENEYLDNLLNVFNECVRITKNTGTIVFNIGDKYEDSGLRLIPQRFAIKAIDTKKVFLVNNLTWEKLNPTPRQDRKKLVQSTEPFFIFAKTKGYTFNLNEFMSHLKYLNNSKSKSNGNGIGKKYFELIDNSGLASQEKEHAKRELQKVIFDVKQGIIESFRMKIRGIHAEPYGGQAGGRQIQLDKNGFTIIRINGERLKRDIIESPVESIKNNQHPAVYPLFIIQELIKLLTNTNDIVLDPFVGSGTSCLAAKNLKRDYIGIEINPDYVNYANERLKTKSQFSMELFI